jgi:ATP synthase protein I
VVRFGLMNESENIPKKPSGALGDLVKAESMIQLAIALPAGCLIGWLVGAWLDKHFHTGWIGIAGILLGAVAGFIQIFTTALKYLKRDSDS